MQGRTDHTAAPRRSPYLEASAGTVFQPPAAARRPGLAVRIGVLACLVLALGAVFIVLPTLGGVPESPPVPESSAASPAATMSADAAAGPRQRAP